MKQMEFEDKARVVAECWMVVRDHEVWDEIVNYGDLGFPLAYSHIAELSELTDDGKKLVVDVYDIILKSLEVEDQFYRTFEDVLDAKIAIQDAEDDEDED